MSSLAQQSEDEVQSVRQALALCKRSFLTAGLISFFINVLVLAPTVYMMQVYDRVMVSNSTSTLVMLTLLTSFLLGMMGLMEWIRSQILVVISNRLDQLLNQRIFNAMFGAALGTGGRGLGAQPLSDFLQIRQFLTGNGLFAFFDAPWLPLNILVMWIFHWTYGVVGVVSGCILMMLNLWTELSTRELLKKANNESMESNAQTQRNMRNVEVIESMGMLGRLRSRWREKQTRLLAYQSKASSRASLISAISKFYRTVIQSLILGLGAYLSINKEISPGSMIAGSILLGRALAPLDLLIGSWKGFVAARDAYDRVEKLLTAMPPRIPPMPLPEPTGAIQLENVAILPQGAKKPIIAGVNLEIPAGHQVAIIGSSAAGKSTLLRAILGIYRAAQGSVRLDGADICQWDREALGSCIGYLPQDVELLDGTISENISRFGEVDSEKVIAAARMSGIHEMILRLPDGYDTQIQGQGAMLSAGQRQRLGLARAVYDLPKIIVLDEPNSNLDQEGEVALAQAMLALRQQQCTVLIVTHRPNILGQVDSIAFMREGQLAGFGPRDEILNALQGKPQPQPQPQQSQGDSALVTQTE